MLSLGCHVTRMKIQNRFPSMELVALTLPQKHHLLVADFIAPPKRKINLVFLLSVLKKYWQYWQYWQSMCSLPNMPICDPTTSLPRLCCDGHHIQETLARPPPRRQRRQRRWTPRILRSAAEPQHHSQLHRIGMRFYRDLRTVTNANIAWKLL